MGTHSSILAWEIAWTEEAGGVQSMGSQRVRDSFEGQVKFLDPRVTKPSPLLPHSQLSVAPNDHGETQNQAGVLSLASSASPTWHANACHLHHPEQMHCWTRWQ